MLRRKLFYRSIDYVIYDCKDVFDRDLNELYEYGIWFVPYGQLFFMHPLFC